MQSTQIRQQSPEAPQIPAAALRDNLTRELKKLGKREKFVWAFVALVCIAIKIPGIWGGRFWAEEGGVFFLNAWNMPWYKALLYSHGGYLNLIGNLAGVLAHYLVPLKYACFVSTITALIIQACPLLIVCFSRATWLQGRKYYIAAMLLIFLNPFSGEVWLNTVASQYHLNLCTAMILSLPVEVGFAALFSRALLALAVLSGPGTYLLLPLFMLRGALNRVRERLIQVSILLTCVLIQLYFFCHPEARVLNAPNASSMFGIDPLLLADIFFLKHFAGPILGFQKSCLSFGTWFIDYRAGHFDLWPAAIVAVGVFLLFGYMVSKSRLIETKWFFLSALSLAVGSYCGAFGYRYLSLHIDANGRYAYAPQILFELTILSLVYGRRNWITIVSTLLTIWLLFIGIREYFFVPEWYAHGPTWRSQVSQWNRDPDYQLKLWPANTSSWMIRLAPSASQ